MFLVPLASFGCLLGSSVPVWAALGSKSGASVFQGARFACTNGDMCWKQAFRVNKTPSLQSENLEQWSRGFWEIGL